MIILALTLMGLIVAVVLLITRGMRREGQPPAAVSDNTHARPARRRPAIDPDTLGRWVVDGLLSAEQAQAILEHEQITPTYVSHRIVQMPDRERRVPVFAEALGYLGGVLALAGLTLLVANYWPDLSTPIRLALSSGTALVLGGAGALIHERVDPALARLRAFLWALSSATAAVFTAVLMIDTLDVATDSLVVAACSATVAFTSGVFWAWRDRPIQELLCIGSAIVAVAASAEAAANVGIAGLAAWLLGSVVLVAGLRDLTPRPIIPHVVGALALMMGAILTIAESRGVGLLFATATAAGLLVLAALPVLAITGVKRLVLVGIGAFGALQCVPQTLAHFADEAGGVTGLVTWAFAAVTMAAGARRMLRAPIVAETIGGLGMIGGAALTGTQWPNFAPVFGLGTALTLLVIGMLPGRVLFTLVGLLGMLINVPWAINTFFPGEGRAPLLILVSGALIVAVAVWLARQSDRLRNELVPQASGRIVSAPDDLGDDPNSRADDVALTPANHGPLG